MILKTIVRVLWVVVAFCIAAFAALAVLFALGSMWVGDELRAAAPPDDPILGHAGGANVFGIVLFASTVTPALTALPGLIAVVVGEVLRVRSWIYYVLAGGASVAAIPLLAGAPAAGTPPVPSGEYMVIFVAAGFAGGFIYWLLAGARA
ncbi:MAG: hypothetical protein ACRECX_10325 [Methyloceanibacter sp.]|uniref:hypothetical protein n=1 Tax=Methyloceanibacter sp. TaxID=1965321 RepID=UPI003D6D2AE7